MPSVSRLRPLVGSDLRSKSSGPKNSRTGVMGQRLVQQRIEDKVEAINPIEQLNERQYSEKEDYAAPQLQDRKVEQQYTDFHKISAESPSKRINKESSLDVRPKRDFVFEDYSVLAINIAVDELGNLLKLKKEPRRLYEQMPLYLGHAILVVEGSLAITPDDNLNNALDLMKQVRNSSRNYATFNLEQTVAVLKKAIESLLELQIAAKLEQQRIFI